MLSVREGRSSVRLWLELARCLMSLAPACSRLVCFGWMSVALFGFCCRRDLSGVTSLVRSSWLVSPAYRRLLHLFYSDALKLGPLTCCWRSLVLRLFRPYRVHGHLVCIADGLQVAKEGRKMPAVKSLFNDSPDNAKARFIMGHAFHAVSLLVESAGARLASIPLLSRIGEGLTSSDAPHTTRPAKLAELFCDLWKATGEKVLLLVDSYYANRSLLAPLLAEGHGVVTRVRLTTTAFCPAPKPRKRTVGRPRLYGKHMVLRRLFSHPSTFRKAILPLYDQNLTIRYRSLDLIWKPLRRVVRFVLVLHPSHPPTIFMTTDLTVEPDTVITLYSYRFKIESGFKQAKHTLGTYGYHFWMAAMAPISKGSGNQSLDGRSERYRRAVAQKIDAYHRFVQLGCIAQGLLLHLSINFPSEVWGSFRSWIRTIRPGLPPSESVVAESLRWTLPEIFASKALTLFPLEFLNKQINSEQLPNWFPRAA